MDIVRSESYLMRSPNQTEILGKLKGSRVCDTRNSLCGVDAEPASDAEDRELRVSRRIVKILYPQIAQREVVVHMLHVARSKQRPPERTDRANADQIGIAQNKR